MRIGIDIRSLIEPFPSGISEYTFQVVKKILQHDQDNEYILFYNSQKKLPPRYQKEFDSLNATIMATHWPNKIFNFILFLGVFHNLDKLAGDLDIFYMPNINFMNLSKNVKLVLTVHDLSFEYPKYFSLKSKYWHKFIRPKKIIKRADRIIAVSENTKQDLLENYQIDENKIEVIYSGVDKYVFENLDDNKKSILKQKYKITNEFFLYLGNLENRKNTTTIIEAWQRYKAEQKSEVQLVMVGKNATSHLRSHQGLIYTGYIDDQEKPYFYALARGFIYPSYYEGFGLPIVEAMAAGCPVITSFSTSLPEIAQKSAVLIDPYNVNECVKAMKLIDQDDDLRRGIIQEGLKLIKRYNWEHTTSRMIKLFNSVQI